jgi:tetratricopeptide (TPR) repeat protein
MGRQMAGGNQARDQGEPAGEVYDWYVRGLDLLARGEPAAAAQVLGHALRVEPDSRSIREALSRAHFDSGRYGEALANFRVLVDGRPDDDYAHFGLGLAAQRLGDLETAAEHLALAAAMRPELRHYRDALRGVRATRKARTARDAGDDQSLPSKADEWPGRAPGEPAEGPER